MEQKKIDRINFLAKKKREKGLTPSEALEQQNLRKEYIESYKRSLVSQIESITVLEKDGTKHKLKKREENNK